MIFENFFVDNPEHLDRDAHMVRTVVFVPVEYLGPLVGRRVGRKSLHVGERIHDGFRGSLDHDLA
jgi:hypothetical protein